MDFGIYWMIHLLVSRPLLCFALFLIVCIFQSSLVSLYMSWAAPNVFLEFLHSPDRGERVGVDVVDGVEVEGGGVAHGGAAVAAASDPGQVGQRRAVLG